jgi:2,5-diketo-D-gluconate reductase A
LGKTPFMTTETAKIPNIPLRGGAQIPQLGFGVFQVPPGETAEPVSKALATGYRHIDTAAAYENEAEVASGIREAGLTREEVFITTKCFNDSHGHEQAKRACHESLSRLGTDYLDLYLIHWPVPSQDRYVETWKAFVELRDEGLVRSIGVSNFQPEHLDRIIEATGEAPAINQIELHPHFSQTGLRTRHAELDIVTEAWSPLGQGLALEDETIQAIAESHGRTPAQVVIRWHLQLGNVVIPKSVTPERIEENFDVFSFHLTEADMESIHALDRGQRTGPDPETFVRP